MTTPAPSDHVKGFVRDLAHVAPRDGSSLPAVRVAISIGTPLVVLLLVDRVQWSSFCTFGAFAAVYGRGLARRPRLEMQSQAAVLLVLAIVAGVAVAGLPHAAWWIVLGSGVAASITAVVADELGWRPPGGLFTVFAFAVCAQTPETGWHTLRVAAALAVGTALFALAVGQVGARGAAVLRQRDGRERRPGAVRRHAVRFFLAPLLSGGLATASGISHPYWGMVASVVPLTAPTLVGMAQRGAHRVLGTGVGLVLAAGVLALHPSSAATVAVIVLAQALAELFVTRNYGIALVFITPLALLMGQLVHPLPASEILTTRGSETAIGVVVGLLVAYATRPRTP